MLTNNSWKLIVVLNNQIPYYQFSFLHDRVVKPVDHAHVVLFMNKKVRTTYLLYEWLQQSNGYSKKEFKELDGWFAFS